MVYKNTQLTLFLGFVIFILLPLIQYGVCIRCTLTSGLIVNCSSEHTSCYAVVELRNDGKQWVRRGCGGLGYAAMRKCKDITDINGKLWKECVCRNHECNDCDNWEDCANKIDPSSSTVPPSNAMPKYCTWTCTNRSEDQQNF